MEWTWVLALLVVYLWGRYQEYKVIEKLDEAETRLEKAKQALRANGLPTEHLEI